MTEYRIEKSAEDETYVLIQEDNTHVWFEKVKIDKSSVRLYDKNTLVAYFPKKTLPKDIIFELENLPKQEK